MINSRSIALVTGVLIASITTAFIWILLSVSTATLVLTWLISFSASAILIRLLLETLFFRHINTIYELLEQIKQDDIKMQLRARRTGLNALKEIKTEISTYASSKQEEIDRLKELENFRREFIADISHELKTPLFAAQGFVHTLLDGAVKDKKVRDKFLKKAARSLDGLDVLVQDLLTISQMENGDIKMHFEDFDLVELAHQVMDQMEGKAEKKNIKLKLECKPKGKLFVHADYQRMLQVLANLVSNAVKYSKKDRQVIIRLSENGDQVLCEIIDQGFGIPAEDMGRIFERFYRVDKSRSKELGGTGLGLAIVKHIMEGHGVTVKVKSEVDLGSTFSFYLAKGNPVEVDEDE